MVSVFITGGGGFIGKRLIARLLEEGIKITVLALPSEIGLFKPSENLTVIEGDLAHYIEIKEKLSGKRFDSMYHLAWVGVSTAQKNDISVQRKNIDFAFAVMELAEEFCCERVICTGSVSEYAYCGEAVNGNQAPSPGDMYAATKTAVHVYCELIARQRGIGFNWVLIPSIYGPGREDNNIVTYSIKTLLSGERPSYTKLEQFWDYIYIDDLIDALFLVGQKGCNRKTYVVGSGKACQLREYIEIIRDAINPNAELGVGDLPYKTSHIDNAVCDISELAKDTGFSPAISFKTGIRKMIEYFR